MVKYACEGLYLYSTGLRPELSCTCSYAMYDDPLPIQLPTGPQKEHCVPLTPHLLFSSSFNLNSSLTHICVQQTLFYDSQYSGFTIENSSACMVFELLRTWNSTYMEFNKQWACGYYTTFPGKEGEQRIPTDKALRRSRIVTWTVTAYVHPVSTCVGHRPYIIMLLLSTCVRTYRVCISSSSTSNCTTSIVQSTICTYMYIIYATYNKFSR